jgi:hypothetical protein
MKGPSSYLTRRVVKQSFAEQHDFQRQAKIKAAKAKRPGG